MPLALPAPRRTPTPVETEQRMPTLQEIGARLAGGGPLTALDCEAVVASSDLLGLGALADDCRRRRHGDRVTFVRVQQIRTDALAAPEIALLPAARELRITGPLPETGGIVRGVGRAVSAAGAVPVTGFALDELVERNASDASAVAELLAALRDAGLAALAEARADRLSGPQWLDAAGNAGLKIASLTVGEPAADDASDALIRRVAAWGGALAHVHAFAPLPRDLPPQPTTGYRDLRQVALARLLVENVGSIQVDWSLYGPKLAQVALLFGAGDVDAVSAEDGGTLGAKRAPLAEIVRNIRASGLVPVERNGRFENVET